MAPDPSLSTGEVKNNNQLAMGAPKAGSGWQESVKGHANTTAGNDEQQEHVQDNEGSNKDGKGRKGDGDNNEGVRQQIGQG